MKKRIFSLLLSGVLCLSLCTTALAAGDEGHWDFSNPSIGPQWVTAEPVNPGSASSGSSGGGGVLITTYSVATPSNTANGKVAVSPTTAKKGDTVTITATPDTGYEVGSVTVKDAQGNVVTVTAAADGKYTFIMPASQVSVSAVFKAVKQEMPDTPWSNPFTDVAESAWYYDAIKFVNQNSLMNGYDDGRFCPNEKLSRAMFAQILYNKEGRPAVNSGGAFTDVASSDWYADAIAWASAKGCINGYGDGRFGPTDDITRQDLAVLLWRYVGQPAPSSRVLNFSDANQSSPYALEALCWAVENGIVNGYDDGTLSPLGTATRAEVAQLLANYLGG